MPSITNIKNIWKAIPAVVAAVMFASCSDEAPEGVLMPDGSEAGYISLSLQSSKATRAVTGTEDDVQSENENLIQNALICLYPTSNKDEAVLNYVSGLNIYSTADSEDKVKILLDNDTRLKLFPGDTNTCGAYIVANIGQAKADSVINNFTTLDAIRKMVVYDNYANRQTRTRFAMDGGTTNILLSQNDNNYSATGKIDLQRVASKITLAVKIADRVTTGEENEEVWTPATEYIVALINNGVCRSSFNTMGEYAYVPASGDVSKGGDYFSSKNVSYTANDDYGPRILSMTEATKNNEYPYVLQRPFYTMPNSWEDENDNMTYMTLRVPWTKDNGASYQYCYYTVPVVREHSIGRNISYRVNLNIDMLGSFVLEDPIVPDLENLSYYAAEWGSATTEVDITSNRYLVVDQNEFTLNNEESITIPFYTSHPVTVKSYTLHYYRYYMDENGTETKVEITPAQRKLSTKTVTGEDTDSICSVSVQNAINISDDNKLIFNHELVEWTPVDANGNIISLNYSSTNDPKTIVDNINRYVRPDKDDIEKSYTRYMAEITLVHSDMVGTSQESLFTETIKITQYPEIYIEATANEANHPNGDIDNTSTLGRMYVNGNQSHTRYRLYTQSANGYYGTSAGSWYSWINAAGLEGNNKCSNMYVLSVTQLDIAGNSNHQYIIGDPRVSNYTDLYGYKYNFVEFVGNHSTNGYPKYRQTTDNEFKEGGTSPQGDWIAANDMNGVLRKLKYYYPTDQSNEKERWIAPKIRIASSYGVCYSNITYEEAVLRCAGYQEMQYPAGRWRVPTVAEVEYIMRLANQGKIPVLFTLPSDDDEMFYWTSQGAIKTNDLGNGNGTLIPYSNISDAAVRCVYDDWYWDDELSSIGSISENGVTVDNYEFTWGDRPR